MRSSDSHLRYISPPDQLVVSGLLFNGKVAHGLPQDSCDRLDPSFPARSQQLPAACKHKKLARELTLNKANVKGVTF